MEEDWSEVYAVDEMYVLLVILVFENSTTFCISIPSVKTVAGSLFLIHGCKVLSWSRRTPEIVVNGFVRDAILWYLEDFLGIMLLKYVPIRIVL